METGNSHVNRQEQQDGMSHDESAQQPSMERISTAPRIVKSEEVGTSGSLAHVGGKGRNSRALAKVRAVSTSWNADIWSLTQRALEAWRFQADVYRASS